MGKSWKSNCQEKKRFKKRQTNLIHFFFSLKIRKASMAVTKEVMKRLVMLRLMEERKKGVMGRLTVKEKKVMVNPITQKSMMTNGKSLNTNHTYNYRLF